MLTATNNHSATSDATDVSRGGAKSGPWWPCRHAGTSALEGAECKLVRDVENLAQTWPFAGNELSRSVYKGYRNVTKRIKSGLTVGWNPR